MIFYAWDEDLRSYSFAQDVLIVQNHHLADVDQSASFFANEGSAPCRKEICHVPFCSSHTRLCSCPSSAPRKRWRTRLLYPASTRLCGGKRRGEKDANSHPNADLNPDPAPDAILHANPLSIVSGWSAHTPAHLLLAEFHEQRHAAAPERGESVLHYRRLSALAVHALHSCLSAVNPYYAIVAVAFASSGSQAGQITFRIDAKLASALSGYTTA